MITTAGGHLSDKPASHGWCLQLVLGCFGSGSRSKGKLCALDNGTHRERCCLLGVGDLPETRLVGVTPYGSDDGTYLLPGQTARTLRVPDPPGTEGRRESDTLLEVEEGRL